MKSYYKLDGKNEDEIRAIIVHLRDSKDELEYPVKVVHKDSAAVIENPTQMEGFFEGFSFSRITFFTMLLDDKNWMKTLGKKPKGN